MVYTQHLKCCGPKVRVGSIPTRATKIIFIYQTMNKYYLSGGIEHERGRENSCSPVEEGSE